MARDHEERSSFLKHEIETELSAERQAKRYRQARWSWTWMTAVCIVLTCSILTNLWLWRRPTYGAFPTDMKDARKAIEYEVREYTGALVFDPKKGRMMRVREPGAIEYFGPPSDEVNQRWHDLLHGQFPVMTDEEAAPFLPNLTRLPETNHYHFE